MNKKLQVLIVDDCKITHFLHKEAIRDCLPSITPRTFYDGEETLKYLVQSKDETSKCFVLLDLNMPVMDGFTFLEKLQESNISNEIIIAIITSSTDLTDKERVLKYPQVVAFLEKPFKTTDFSKIEKYLK